jgi:hypothetical protein
MDALFAIYVLIVHVAPLNVSYMYFGGCQMNNSIGLYAISIQMMICSNHGRCLCNECFCDVDFAGEFCNVSTVSIYVLAYIIPSHK